jgi:SPP1 gp7 family putative phage head morphogenesis protein
MPTALDLIAKYRKRLDAQSADDIDRLVSAYGRMSQRLKDKVDLLLMEIERDPALVVTKTERYTELVAALNEEFAKYNVYLETELERIAAEASAQAAIDSRALVLQQLKDRGIGVSGQIPAARVVQTSVFAEGSAAYTRLHELAPIQAQRIIDNLLQGINQGKGYKAIGKAIVDDLGLPLSDALRWARTTQMEAYREAGHNTMLENSDIIDGWTWFAQLDEATCDPCKDSHGTFHTADESLTDLTAHIWNCRCCELPHVIGDPNPITGAPVESDEG